LSIGQFDAWGIDPVHHEARVVGKRFITIPRDECLRLYGRLQLTCAPSVVDRQQRTFFSTWYRLRVGPESRPITAIMLADDFVTDLPVVPFAPDGASLGLGCGSDPFPSAFPCSVAHDLLRLAESLSHKVPWQIGEAARFVLTGLCPQPPSTKVKIRRPFTTLVSKDDGTVLMARHRGEITITAPPSESPDAVRQLFGQAQQAWFGRGRYGQRTLAAVEFMIEQGYAKLDTRHPDWPGWKAIVERFDRAHPDLSYHGDIAAFRRDYTRAKERLTSL